MMGVSTDMAPFRIDIFRSFGEFETYLHASEAERSTRWIYERSLASRGEAVVMMGSCGLCLQPTQFTSPTQGGEPAPGGLMPNWREGQACACEHRLISRERALLHYLLAASLLRPWTRVLLMGDAQALNPVMKSISGQVDYHPGRLDAVLDHLVCSRNRYHLIISIEQLTSRHARPETMRNLASLLVSGGEIVFTAPFIVDGKSSDANMSQLDSPISWNVIGALNSTGFTAGRVGTYWSEELGYLGFFSMLIMANKI